MSDLISRKDAIRVASGYCHPSNIPKELEKLPSAQQWIPIKTRPLAEDEKEEHGDWEYIYDCPLPDDGQEVLVTDCYGNVEMDTFCRDYEGVYFEDNCDDGEVLAWMPIPEPYRKEGDAK